jgi:hypothetical protein
MPVMWQRLVRASADVAVGYSVLMVGFMSTAGSALGRELLVAIYGILLGLLLLGVMAQFSARCPR